MELRAKRSKSAGLRARPRERERERERERVVVIIFCVNGVVWEEEISKGAHQVGSTHQGVPGGAGAPWLVVPTWCTSLRYYLHQKFINIQKNRIRFLEHCENFYFWVIFLLHGKSRKQTKHDILFYLTSKNRKKR